MTELREDLDNAIEQLSQDTHGDAVHSDGTLDAAPETGETPPETPEEPPKSPDATPEEPESEPESPPEPSEPETPTETPPEPETPVETVSKPTDSIKAPVGWPPQAREQWSRLPRNVQEQVAERERSIERLMQDVSAARKTHQRMEKLSTGYAQLLAAEGKTDAMDAVEGLFQTTAFLMTAPPAQKAQKMAQLIKHYNVDIAALDDALTGGQGAPSQNAQFEELLNQRLAPLQQHLQQFQTREQQRREQDELRAAREVEQFDAEFIEDVRLDMADLIDFYAERDQQLSLQQAYDMAIQRRPDIQQILSGRQQETRETQRQQTLESKRNAASSVSGHQGGSGANSEDRSLREELEHAMANQR